MNKKVVLIISFCIFIVFCGCCSYYQGTIWQNARENNVDGVRLALTKGLGVNARSSRGLTPIAIAAEYGSMDVLKYLISRGAIFEFNENTKSISINNEVGIQAAKLAVYHGQKEALQCLVDNGVDPRFQYEYHTFREFRKNGTKASVSGKTLLHLAAQEGYVDIIEYLMKKKADVNGRLPAEPPSPFNKNDDSSINWGSYGEMDAGFTPLHYASAEGHLEAVKTLLEQGADLSIKDAMGNTPLYYAAKGGYSEIVKTLINQEAEINIGNYRGETPLMLAVLSGNYDSMKALLDAGSDVNRADKFNKRAIHFISSKKMSRKYWICYFQVVLILTHEPRVALRHCMKRLLVVTLNLPMRCSHEELR